MASNRLQYLLELARNPNRIEPLNRTVVPTAHMNITVRVQGGARNIPYLRVLDSLACRWRDLVRSHITARVVWGVTVGAGIGGPTGEPDETYLYGAYHAWPLYEVGDVTDADIQALKLTLFYGVAALLRHGVVGSGRSVLDMLTAARAGPKYAAAWKKAIIQRAGGTFTLLDAMINASPPNEQEVDRTVDYGNHCVSGATYCACSYSGAANQVVHEAAMSSETVVDGLLTLAWILIGHNDIAYMGGILCGAFPVLVSGPNAKLERFNRLASRIAMELELTGGISSSRNSIHMAWLGMSQLLATPSGARVASFRCGEIGRALNSKWMEVLGKRMPYHGLTSLLLIATAILRFPHAGWTNFLNLDQPEYTAVNTHIMVDRITEYSTVIDTIGHFVTLPFTLEQFLTAPSDQKITMLITAYKCIRPMKIYGDWISQGEIVLNLIEQALMDPFMMYKDVQGRSREIADFAYYAFLLLKDVAHQNSLQNFTNIYASAAVRPQEVERLVRDFGTIITKFPGSSGYMEFTTTEVRELVSVITNPYEEHGPDPARIEQTLDNAGTVIRTLQQGRSVLISEPEPAAQLPPQPPNHRRNPRTQTWRAPVAGPSTQQGSVLQPFDPDNPVLTQPVLQDLPEPEADFESTLETSFQGMSLQGAGRPTLVAQRSFPSFTPASNQRPGTPASTGRSPGYTPSRFGTYTGPFDHHNTSASLVDPSGEPGDDDN